MRLFFKLGTVLLPVVFAGCMTAGGAKHFKEGERLRASGSYSEAQREYEQALSAEPNNDKYRERMRSLREQIEHEVERLRGEARAKEKAGEWAAASALYAQALALKGADQDLEARKELSAAKAKNLDPDGWYTEVSRIQSRLSGVKIVDRTLAGARANAYQYHLAMGAKLLEAQDGSGAVRSFDRAKEIEPATPGWNAEQYDHARALDLAAQGELRALAGDTIEAHDLYEKAYGLKPLPEIKKKLAELKTKAAAILKKLDLARSKAKQGRHAEALRLYNELAMMKGAPASVSEEAMKVRAELAQASALDAERAADRGDLRRAKASLLEALRVAELGAVPNDAIKLAIDQTNGGQPGKAVETIDGSTAPADHPVTKAARAYARAGAKSTLSRAQALAKKDAAKALVLLSELRSFEKELPEIAALRQSLRKGAFSEMLAGALAAAKSGDDREASDLLLAALRASKAPAAMRGPAEEACRLLADRKYAEAERSFQAALAAAPRSTLAQRGVDITRLRKRAGEREAVEIVKSGKGDLERAVSALQSALHEEPGNPSAKEAAQALISRIRGTGAGMDDLALAAQLSFATRLSDLPVPARDALEQGNGALAQGNYAEAETRYKQAETAAPDSPVAALARSYSKDRMLASLKSGVNGGAGDEASARALAKLLKADPKNRDARAALRALLDKAEQSGKAGDDAEAARYLTLVVVATDPAPGVKLALDKGNQALGAGNMGEAEKLYSEALDLEVENDAAKLGLSLARSARVAGLKEAVSKAKSGEGVVQAQEALRRTLEIDPNSPEARQAFADLLDGAKNAGKQGSDREAAQLLDTANVVSKPETARKAIAAANKLLADGRHADAEAAYEKLLAGAESQVARAGQEISRDRRIQVLLAGVAELKNGGDLDRGAKATKELLALDGTHPEARAAIEAALSRADEAADRGDDAGAAKELRAADVALGGESGVQKAIADLERGKLEQAEASFAKLDSEVAQRGVEIAKRRRMGTLKAGLTGDDKQAAESIRAVLATDPNNREAQAAFAKLLDRARSSAKKGDDRDAAAALETAISASGAPEELSSTLKIGVTHLSEARYAEAEVGFTTALEISRDSKVAAAGRDIARDRRKAAEKSALDAINKGGDPLKPAQVLQATLIVEPDSRAASTALSKLLARAKKSASKGDVADAARALDAAAMLEGLPSVMVTKIGEANMALSGGEFAEAEGGFDAALAGGEDEAPRKSQVASLGKTVARERRLVQLKDDLAKAQRDKDVLRAGGLVQQILSIDPNDRNAKALSKKIGSDVVSDRLQVAMTQKGFGKLGVAHLYLSRVLALDPEHAQAKAELESIESTLKESKDLIVKVAAVTRGKKVSNSACKEMEATLRDELMSEASEKEDLGLYVLGKSYTEAVERGDADAPKVTGGLVVTLTSCQHGSSTGKLGFDWKLETPEKGRTVAEGAADAELPAGLLPRDEQDGAGKNARKALAKRAVQALLGKLEAARPQIDEWLLVASEQAMEQKDAAKVAEHFAKLKLVSKSYDRKRAEKIEKYLDAELK